MSSPSAAPLTLIELAGLLGRYRYVELALFQAVGLRASLASDPALCVYLSAASHAHAYRVGLIEERLPVSVGLPDVVSCTKSPGPAIDVLIADIAQRGDSDVLVALVEGWYPAMLSGYRRHLEAASSPSDAPIIRMLGRLTFDLKERIGEGLALVGTLGISGEAGTLTAAFIALGGPFSTLVL